MCLVTSPSFSPGSSLRLKDGGSIAYEERSVQESAAEQETS